MRLTLKVAIMPAACQFPILLVRGPAHTLNTSIISLTQDLSEIDADNATRPNTNEASQIH